MSSSSAGHTSGANSSQDGLSNMRMIAANALKWGVVAVAVMIAVVWIKFFPPWGGIMPISYPPQNVAYTTSTTISPAGSCDYQHRRLELGSTPVKFNPDQCVFHFMVTGGPIEFDGPQGKVVMQPNEVRDLSQMWFDTAKAVDGHAVLLYQLVN